MHQTNRYVNVAVVSHWRWWHRENRFENIIPFLCCCQLPALPHCILSARHSNSAQTLLGVIVLNYILRNQSLMLMRCVYKMLCKNIVSRYWNTEVWIRLQKTNVNSQQNERRKWATDCCAGKGCRTNSANYIQREVLSRGMLDNWPDIRKHSTAFLWSVN